MTDEKKLLLAPGERPDMHTVNIEGDLYKPWHTDIQAQRLIGYELGRAAGVSDLRDLAEDPSFTLSEAADALECRPSDLDRTHPIQILTTDGREVARARRMNYSTETDPTRDEQTFSFYDVRGDIHDEPFQHGQELVVRYRGSECRTGVITCVSIQVEEMGRGDVSVYLTTDAEKLGPFG